jgi:hypothetical protein
MRSPRTKAVVVCALLVLVCLAYDHWRAVLPPWWRDHGGGIPYVLFWITAWFVLIPRRGAVLPICVGVTVATCLLEVLQLWQPGWLMEFRGTRFGAAWLGSGFTLADIPPYLIGGVLGYGLLVLAPVWSRSGRGGPPGVNGTAA